MKTDIKSVNSSKLLNAGHLAAALGFSRTHVSAMRRCGFKFLYGMRTTEQSALDWLAAHPEFRIRDAYPEKQPVRRRRPSLEFHCDACGIAMNSESTLLAILDTYQKKDGAGTEHSQNVAQSNAQRLKTEKRILEIMERVADARGVSVDQWLAELAGKAAPLWQLGQILRAIGRATVKKLVSTDQEAEWIAFRMGIG